MSFFTDQEEKSSFSSSIGKPNYQTYGDSRSSLNAGSEQNQYQDDWHNFSSQSNPPETNEQKKTFPISTWRLNTPTFFSYSNDEMEPSIETVSRERESATGQVESEINIASDQRTEKGVVQNPEGTLPSSETKSQVNAHSSKGLQTPKRSSPIRSDSQQPAWRSAAAQVSTHQNQPWDTIQRQPRQQQQYTDGLMKRSDQNSPGSQTSVRSISPMYSQAQTEKIVSATCIAKMGDDAHISNSSITGNPGTSTMGMTRNEATDTTKQQQLPAHSDASNTVNQSNPSARNVRFADSVESYRVTVSEAQNQTNSKNLDRHHVNPGRLERVAISPDIAHQLPQIGRNQNEKYPQKRDFDVNAETGKRSKHHERQDQVHINQQRSFTNNRTARGMVYGDDFDPAELVVPAGALDSLLVKISRKLQECKELSNTLNESIDLSEISVQRQIDRLITEDHIRLLVDITDDKNPLAQLMLEFSRLRSMLQNDLNITAPPNEQFMESLVDEA